MIIREARCDDAAGIARIHVESWRTTYRGIVPDDVLERLSEERRVAYWSDVLCREPRSDVVYVAEDERGAIAGFAAGGPERDGTHGYDGELYAIYLLEAASGAAWAAG